MPEEQDHVATARMLDYEWGDELEHGPYPPLLVVRNDDMSKKWQYHHPNNHHKNEREPNGQTRRRRRRRRRTESVTMMIDAGGGDVQHGGDLWHRDQEAEWERWKETIREVRHFATGILFLLLIRGIIVRCCHNGRTTTPTRR
jgi:hypothetical protein